MIKVQSEDFDISEETRKLCKGRVDIGAIVSFTGVVRQAKKNVGNDSRKLLSMRLEHYPGMTERELARIEQEARCRWDLQDCLIIHRHGELAPGDNIVLVITLSRHRRDAFAAASFLMDYLKTSAPFWKKEKFTDRSDWVKAKEKDLQASKAWQRDDVAE